MYLKAFSSGIVLPKVYARKDVKKIEYLLR